MKIVITGGCKGLGLELTTYAASLGHTVYALYNKSIDVAYELEKKYDNIRTIKCDVKNENEVDNVLFNIGEFDCLINNSGIAIDNSYKDKSKREFMSVLETNLVGTFLMIKSGIDKLNENGIIINISSNNALYAYSPLAMDYDASKAGINILTKDFALIIDEEKRTTRIVAICPGWINTDAILEMNPDYLKDELKKVGQEKLIDKKALAKYLIDNISNFKNGEIIDLKNMEALND